MTKAMRTAVTPAKPAATGPDALSRWRAAVRALTEFDTALQEHGASLRVERVEVRTADASVRCTAVERALAVALAPHLPGLLIEARAALAREEADAKAVCRREFEREAGDDEEAPPPASARH